MQLALDELRAATAGPDRLADAAHGPGVLLHELAPEEDDARRVVVDLHQFDRGVAEGVAQRGERLRPCGHPHRFPPLQTFMDVREHAVEQPVGADVPQRLVVNATAYWTTARIAATSGASSSLFSR